MGCAASRQEAPGQAPLSGLGAGGAGASAMVAAGGVPRVKLVLLGDSGVGKSCLVLRFVRGQFDPTSKVTVGAAFMSHPVALPDGTTVKFEIWDTAGQERYASLAPLYYRGASAAVVVYDITSPESLGKASFWVKELRKNASPDVVLALVGNKADLEGKREVSREEAQAIADEHHMFHIETSAKSAINVAELFESIARKLPGGTEAA